MELTGYLVVTCVLHVYWPAWMDGGHASRVQSATLAKEAEKEERGWGKIKNLDQECSSNVYEKEISGKLGKAWKKGKQKRKGKI